MTKVELTAPDGSKVWIFTAWIQVVRGLTAHERAASPGIGAVLHLSGEEQFVRETVDEVLHLLEFA